MGNWLWRWLGVAALRRSVPFELVFWNYLFVCLFSKNDINFMFNRIPSETSLGMSWETFEDRRESRKSRLYWIIFSFFSALGEDSTIFEVWRPFEGLEREIETEVTIRPLSLTATVAVVEIWMVLTALLCKKNWQQTGCFFGTNTPGTNSWTLGFHFSVYTNCNYY